MPKSLLNSPENRVVGAALLIRRAKKLPKGDPEKKKLLAAANRLLSLSPNDSGTKPTNP